MSWIGNRSRSSARSGAPVTGLDSSTARTTSPWIRKATFLLPRPTRASVSRSSHTPSAIDGEERNVQPVDSEELHMADDKRREEWEPPSSPDREQDAETPPTAAEQKDVSEVIADEYRDDRFQASDN